jgi:L-asparagine oxygenase
VISRPVLRELLLGEDEAEQVGDAATAAMLETGGLDALLDRARLLSSMLPERVRGFVEEFRLGESAAVCRLRGPVVDDVALGPTPAHWAHSDPQRLDEPMSYLVLVSALLGDAFGWAVEQDGRIVQDLLPIEGDEDRQISSSSRAELVWHTDEAFHPMSCDYVLLSCLRNPDGVATSVSVPDLTRLDPRSREVLFEPRFVIMAEPSHLPDLLDGGASEDRRAHDDARQRELAEIDHTRLPLLHADPADPYLRWDGAFTDVDRLDPEARRAYHELAELIEGGRRDVVLEPGDVLVIDNQRCTHARAPFTARYDGTDRWLRRIYVTRDLRRSRALRAGAASRVLL